MSTNPYNPVTTTDSTRLADDDWGLNLPSVRYRNYDQSRSKAVCNFIRERSRLFVIFGCILIVGIVIISIIAVATQRSSSRKPTEKDKEKRWQLPTEGLAFYPIPQDGSTVLSFSVEDHSSSLIENLNSITEEYKLSHQFDPSAFTECKKDTHPPNKTCRFNNHVFGDMCTFTRKWGYPSATPCIFLQLNLPDNTMIRPISKSSLLWPVSQYIMGQHNDSSHIPVSCEGTTAHDRLILNVDSFDKKDPRSIQYYPNDGLASFYYRQRNMSLPFIKPAMFVRVVIPKDNVMVHITCTAWGQLYDFEGKMLQHPLLKTSFGIYMTAD